MTCKARKTGTVALAVVVCGLAASATALAAPAGAVTPTLKVVATNLNNPRKLFVGSGGAVYVAEAGTGGDRCLATCIGPTGSITRIENGAQARVVTGLMSAANPTRQAAEGPADVLVEGGTYYVLQQDMGISSKGVNLAGMATAGDLISSPAGKASARVIADLAAFEAAHNPDHGAGPGAKFGQPPIDSNPYAFVAYRGGFAVADAAANDLLWISPKGVISVLAVFPTQKEKLTKTNKKEIGAPPTLTSLDVQSVPTSVAVGPDGALYVGELTGWPFQPGTAHIWRIVPGKKPSLYASGFTNISDLAFDGKNLLVLEIASKGLQADNSYSGALIRLAPNGARTVLASAGLVAPTGLAIANGSIYISNYGLFPGTGAGPHGEVVTIPASLAS